MAVAELAEQHEVGVGVRHPQATSAQPGDEGVPLLAERRHGRERFAGQGQHGPGHRLGDRGQVVGQPDQEQGLRHRRVRGQVPDPRAGQRERLGHGAGHHEPPAAGQQGERGRRGVPGELGVRLVHDDHARGRRADRLDHLGGQRGPGGVVRRGKEDQVRLMVPDRGQRVIGLQAEVGVPGAADPAGAGGQGDQRVHRVGRLEAQRGPPLAAERLEQLLDDLVGAVGHPHLVRVQPAAEIGGQVTAERHRVAVRVAVQRPGYLSDGLGDRQGQGR